MFCETQRTTELSIIKAFATTFATPIHSVGNTYSGTTYFNTITVTAPASPPAISAKPRNSTKRAFQATPFPLYEKLSAESRDLSIELITSMPSALQMLGIQSTKVMCTAGSEPLSADFE